MKPKAIVAWLTLILIIAIFGIIIYHDVNAILKALKVIRP